MTTTFQPNGMGPQIKFKVHKVLTLTVKKCDQRDYKNSDKNRLVEIKVKLKARAVTSLEQYSLKLMFKSCSIG